MLMLILSLLNILVGEFAMKSWCIYIYAIISNQCLDNLYNLVICTTYKQYTVVHYIGSA